MDLFYTYINDFEGNSTHEKQHNAGRFIIRYVAENIYKIENHEIEIINKKPKFKYSDMEFSISHSNEITAVCFDKNPVGLDIEFIRSIDFEAVSKRMNFTLKEHSIEEFYKNWTLYEAEIKLQNKVQSYKTKFLFDKYVLSIASVLTKEFEPNIQAISLK